MISKLTLGTAQLGLDYGINNHTGKPDIDESMEILEYAYMTGIKSIDTAAAYGDSEAVIGKWIENYKHNDLYITSKIPSINKLNISEKDLAGYVEKQVYSSLERLSIEKLNDIMLHDYNDLACYGENLFNALVNLKDKGYVESIGCSIYDSDFLEVLSRYNFDTIQLPGSIFKQDILESDKLKELKKRNVKTFVRSAFVQGLVFMEPSAIPAELMEIRDYLVKLGEISKDNNVSIREIALGYLMNHQAVDSVVFGVESINQLKEIVSIQSKNYIEPKIIKDNFFDIPKELTDPRNWRF